MAIEFRWFWATNINPFVLERVISSPRTTQCIKFGWMGYDWRQASPRSLKAIIRKAIGVMVRFRSERRPAIVLLRDRQTLAVTQKWDVWASRRRNSLAPTKARGYNSIHADYGGSSEQDVTCNGASCLNGAANNENRWNVTVCHNRNTFKKFRLPLFYYLNWINIKTTQMRVLVVSNKNITMRMIV